MPAAIRRLLPALLLLITACQPSPPAPPPEIGFTRFQPIYLDVAKIDIVDEYQSPMKSPNVEHLLPVSPAEAMHVWVRDRLRAVGTGRSLQVIIKDASVTVTALPKPGGMQGFFTVSQDKRYDGRLDVEMRIYNGGAMSEANIEATVTRSITMSERVSLAEREALFRRMIYDMMEEMNAEMEKQMYTYFGNYISYSRHW
ncbi:MAG: hypothetical protein KGJ06_08150 [Pseudomonadota bacterium]|nr:hypothetical protein [Pseudomonadota bacterium]